MAVRGWTQRIGSRWTWGVAETSMPVASSALFVHCALRQQQVAGRIIAVAVAWSGTRRVAWTVPGANDSRCLLVFPLADRVRPRQAAAAVRLQHHHRAQDGRATARRRHHRLRDGQPRRPDAEAHRRKADRNGSSRRYARLFDVEGHSAPSPRDLRLVRDPLRRRARSGERSDLHYRFQRRNRALGAGDARARRRRAGPESQLSDPHLRPGDRRRRHSTCADHAGRRLLR